MIRFTKMHGIGNDYVYIDGFEQPLPDDLPAFARALSHRHTGIGSDGLILLLPSDHADVRMRMFNADGSEAEMCGNGIRCLARYAFEHDRAPARPCTDPRFTEPLNNVLPNLDQILSLDVQTPAGILTVALALVNNTVNLIAVDMGAPRLLPSDIPVKVTGQQVVSVPVHIADHDFLMTCLSMGNPHAVVYVPDVAALDLNHLGPAFENHHLFPQRINAHFVQVVSPHEVIMRTWERGSGITLACGTGAAAVCVAGVLTDKTAPSLLAHLPGGDLHLTWRSADDQHVIMIGPAVTVFSGEIDLHQHVTL